MSAKRGFSLSRSQRQLAAEMPGRAPSLSTMQRHATAGALNACKSPGSGKRTLYDPDKLREHYEAWVDAEAPVRPANNHDTGATVPQMHGKHVEQIAKAIVAPLVEQIQRLSQEVAGLNALRAALMQKYDAAAALAFDRAESLAKQLSDTRRLVDLDMRVARLAAEVGKVSTLLGNSASAAL